MYSIVAQNFSDVFTEHFCDRYDTQTNLVIKIWPSHFLKLNVLELFPKCILSGSLNHTF